MIDGIVKSCTAIVLDTHCDIDLLFTLKWFFTKMCRPVNIKVQFSAEVTAASDFA